MKLNDIPNSQYDLGPLPEMETYDDAVAVSEKEHDQFFVAAFRLKSWLADLLIEGFTRLAPESRQPCGSPQTGQAWRGFLEVFGPLSDHELPYVIGVLHRFVKYNDPLPELLLRAHAALGIEHRLTGDYIGLRTLHVARAKGPPAVLLMRRSAERWCDWLDATIHLETHGHCQLSRSRPDLDLKSEIVAFGLPLCWLPTPEHSTHPLHTDTEPQPWPQREIDTLLIGLQPLAKRNDWTCGDLLKVVRKLALQPLAYPCWSEADLASYRHKALALPPLPPGPGPEDKDLFPVGFDVAISLCPPLHGDPLSQPLWS